MLFLPECFSFIGASQPEVGRAGGRAGGVPLRVDPCSTHTPACYVPSAQWLLLLLLPPACGVPQSIAAGQPLDGPLMDQYRQLARWGHMSSGWWLGTYLPSYLPT